MSNKRKEILATGEIYHVFNRSVAKENIFIDKRNAQHAIDLIDFYRFPQSLRFSYYKRLESGLKHQYELEYKNQNRLIVIYAYCLMPDHFHLLLKQNTDNGIKTFISNFQNSYSKYFNLYKGRTGSLFQSPFKAKRVSSDEEFIHLSRYIHLNPVSSFLYELNDLVDYKNSSYPIYIYNYNSDLMYKRKILKIAGSVKKYSKFVENHADYQRKLNTIKHLSI
jgi:putative transposase